MFTFFFIDFLEKNRDTFSNDLKHVIANSNNRLIKTIFPADSLNLVKKERILSIDITLA